MVVICYELKTETSIITPLKWPPSRFRRTMHCGWQWLFNTIGIDVGKYNWGFSNTGRTKNDPNWIYRKNSLELLERSQYKQKSCTKVVFFCYLATHLLSRPSPVQQGVNKGILIGYTTSGTPLYSFTSPQSVVATAKVFLKQVLAETESRQIFYFLCLNLVGTYISYLGPLLFSKSESVYITSYCTSSKQI